jgi:hypothetical protein
MPWPDRHPLIEPWLLLWRALRRIHRSRPRIISADEARARLRERVRQAGGYAALARELGVSAQYIHRAATGAAPITGRLLPLLGLERHQPPAAYRERPRP